MAVTAASLKVVVGADTKDAESGLKRVGGLVSGFGKTAAIAGTALVAGLAVGFGKTISVASSFEATLSGVQAVSNATAGEMAQLRTQALALGQDVTLTGISAQDAARAMEELSKGGVSVADQLGGATRGALLLASAGGLDVARAAEIAADSMNIFGLAGGDVVKVADLFAAAANSSSLEVSDLAMSMSQGGQVAHQLGFSIQDTTAAFAAFGAAGLKGSDAGTSLKTALLNLTNPTDKARAVMEQYGLSFFDANGKMLDFQGIAGQLQTNLKGLTDQQRLAALETIFGADAVRVASILYNEGADGIKAWNEQVGQSGAAAAMGAKRNDNLRGSIEQLKSSWETAQIALGTAFLPLLRQLVDQATAVVNAAIPLINVLGPRLVAGIQRGAGAIAAFAGAFGALATAFKTGDFNRAFGPFVAAISDAFGSKAAGQVTLFVSDALVALQRLRDGVLTAKLAFQGKWLDSEVILAPVRQVGIAFSALGAIIRPVIEAINNPLGALADAFSRLAEKVPVLQGPLQAVFKVIAENAGPIGVVAGVFLALGPAITVVSAVLPALLAGFGLLVPVLGALLGSFGIIADVVGVLGGPLTVLALAVGALALAWSQNWGGIRDQTAGVVAIVQGFIVGTLLPALQGIATFVTGTLVPAWQVGWAAVMTAWAPVAATILPALQTMWAGIVSGVQQALPGLTILAGGFLALVQAATPFVQAIMAEVLPTLQELGGNIIAFATTVIPQFAAAFAAMAAALGPIVGNIAAGIGIAFAGIAAFLTAHGDTIKAVLSGAWTFISNTIGAALTIISGLISAALLVISGNWSGAWATLQRTAATAWGQIQTAIGGAVQAIGNLIKLGLETARDAAAAVWNAMTARVAGAMAQMGAAVAGGVVRVVGIFSALPGQILGAVGNLGGLLVGAGAALVQGFINGINSKIGEAKALAASIAGGIIGGVEGALGIKSPSKVMADIGRDTILGLVEGMDDAQRDALKKAAEIASSVAGALKSGLEALTALGEFKAPKAGAVSAFGASFTDFFEKFTTWAGGWEEDVLKQSGLFADAASKAAGLLKSGAEALTSLRDFVAPPEAAVSAFGRSMTDYLEKLTTWAGGFEEDGLAAASAFAEAASKSVGFLKGAVDGLMALTDFEAPTEAAVSAFGRAVADFMEKLGTWAGGFEADGLTHSVAFAEAASKAVALLKSGVDGFAALETFIAPSERAVSQFGAAVADALEKLETWAGGFEKDGLAAAEAFAGSAGKVLSAIGGGVEGLMKLNTFTAPSQQAIDNFAAAIAYFVRRCAEVAAHMGTEGVQQAGAFGVAANSALTAAKTGIDAFIALGKLAVPSQQAIDQLLAGITYTVLQMGAIADHIGKAGVANAVAFAVAVQTTFTTMKTAIDLFGTLAALKKGPAEAVDELLSGVKGAVAKAGDLIAEAQELGRQAIRFRDAMDFARATFGEGMGGTAAFPGDASTQYPAMATVPAAPPATGGHTVTYNSLAFNAPVYGAADFDRRVQEAMVKLDRLGA